MPTNVIDAGHARTYGSAWSTAGQAINEGLGQVLGYYQEYQRQKRFEAQQAQEAHLRAQEMADRAEYREAQRKQMEDMSNQRKALAATQRAQLMGADVDPNALPEDWVDTKTVEAPKFSGLPDQAAEFAGPQASQIQVGTEQKAVKTPKKFVEYGDYVAPLDFGGVEATKQAQLAKQADWLPIQNDVTIAGQTFKAGTRVPPAIWALAGKETAAPKTENIGGRLKGYNAKTGMFDIDYGPAGSPKTGETVGGAYKAVYDKEKKEDVMANDAMIAQNPQRYGPAKKGEGGGKPALAGEVRKITEIRQGLAGIADLRKAVSGQGNTGLVSRFAAWVPGVTQITGWGTDAKSRQATILLVKQLIGKGLEGGVLRKEDEAKYANILPTMGDSTEVAINKVDQLEQRLRENEEIELDTLERAGRDVTGLKGGGSARPGSAPKTNPLGMAR